MKYARLEAGTVAEIIDLPDGVDLNDAFHPDIAAALVSCGSDVEQGWTYTDGTFAAPVAVQPTAAELKSYAAAKRFALETGGFVFNGALIATDRDSQGKIGNAALAAQIVGSSFATAWKCLDGTFVSYTHDDILAMATAVMNFVNACFASESAVDAEIASGAITTQAQVDAASWPANS